MNDILSDIANIIRRYEIGEFISKDKLIDATRKLSCNIFYLTEHNITAFREYNTIKYNENTSVSKAEIKAHEEVPELRMTRKILEAARGVSIAMNNELSIMKRD